MQRRLGQIFTCILKWGRMTCKKSRPYPARAYTTLVVLVFNHRLLVEIVKYNNQVDHFQGHKTFGYKYTQACFFIKQYSFLDLSILIINNIVQPFCDKCSQNYCNYWKISRFSCRNVWSPITITLSPNCKIFQKTLRL